MAKITLLDGYSVNPGDLCWDTFRGLGDFTVYDKTPADLTVERIGDSDMVLSNKVLLTRGVIESCKNLKYIGVLATGYNNVDLEAASEHGITVTNIPAYSTQSVVQHVFALLLEHCSKVAHHDARVKAGAWENNDMFCFWDYPLIELWGKTLGIVGFGRIGSSVAKVALAFGMKVLACTRTKKEMSGVEFVSLEELLQKSDCITLHAPLADATKGMINKDTIRKMKDGVMIVNTGRGLLIVEQDVLDGLNSGKISCYMADVFSTEPPAKGNRLIRQKNTIITPHYAWAPKEARMRLMGIAYDNIKAYLGGHVKNKVNV